MLRIHRALFVVALSLLSASLTGCTLATTAPPIPVAGAHLQGVVHGGQNPVSGSHVYLYAANTAGYNTTSATYGSVSLLQATSSTPPTVGATTKDANGNYYVTTASDGSFSVTGDYTCTPDSGSVPGQQVYMYVTGGDSGGGTNPSLGLMAVLGDCPAADSFAAAVPYIVVNEVTTIAAAYAMAGFAYDATHVSSSSTTLAKVGVKNAFANASNLASLSAGTAYATTPAANGGNGTVPQATINTLANILAACVNSTGAVTGPTSPTACYTLFHNAESSGSTGTVPTDTATAAINIAHNPGANIATLYGLPTGTPPFGSALTAQPNDFSLGLIFSGSPSFTLPMPYGNPLNIDGSGNVRGYGGQFSSLGAVSTWTTTCSLGYGSASALDASGNLWTAYHSFSPTQLTNITQFGSSGTCLQQFTATPDIGPMSMAIDGSGNIWVDSNTITIKYSNTGTDLSGSTGFTHNNSSDNVSSIAFDTSGNAWLSNGTGYIHKFNSSGTLQTPSIGWATNTASNGDSIYSIALDSSGNLWSANDACCTSNRGVYEIMTPTDTSTTSYNYVSNSGNPYGIAFDGAGDVVMASDTGCITKISPTTHLTLTGTTGCIQAPQVSIQSMAIDGSGNLWLGGANTYYIAEVLGFAAPVVTPIALAVKNSAIGTRP